MLFPCLECLPFSSFGGWFCLIFRPQLKCHPISVHSIPCSSHFPLEQGWQKQGLATCFGEQSLLLHPFPYWLAGQNTPLPDPALGVTPWQSVCFPYYTPLWNQLIVISVSRSHQKVNCMRVAILPLSCWGM